MVRGRRMMGDNARVLEQLALLVESVGDYAIFVLDPEGHVLSWNPGAERIKGWLAEEIVGEHFGVFYTAEDRARRHPEEALRIAASEGRFEEEGWRVRKDGAQFWASVLMVPLRDAGGELRGFGKVTRDLTEARHAREQLELFASSAAHDLQEPLRTLSGFVELLERQHGDALPAQGLEYLGHMHTAALRMQQVIEDLLTFALSGSGGDAREEVTLVTAAETAIDALRSAIAGRGLEIRVDLPADAKVRADRHGVELLLQNLLANAVKFADPAAPTVAVSAAREGPDWVVAVVDNGAGVPEHQRERIFEPFAQLERDVHGGTGLGLSIVRRIADRNNGRVGVEPAPDGGSRFWFALPAAD